MVPCILRGMNSVVSAGITTRDGTAERDRDFKGKAQKQVQFNPGQTRASWRVRILSDGEHEHSETFQVVLSEPVLAVLEFPTVTTVEIIDPGDGECDQHLPYVLVVGLGGQSAFLMEKFKVTIWTFYTENFLDSLEFSGILMERGKGNSSEGMLYLR